jgi:2-keto-3-deoxy-L-rhamnonate aldolase RhmA
MTRTRPPAGDFRRRLLAREPLLGTFVKTPSIHTTEILGGLGFDFVVVDAEHAPFDRVTTDQILLAAKAWDIPAMVRVPHSHAAAILGVLDDGAAGVLVPHVASGETARAVAAAARYRGGKRGFSNSPRAGRYGAAGFWEHVDAQDAAVVCMAMIEDPEALDRLDEILATPGLDAAFIGRGDLTIALGAAAPDAPEVRAAVDRIAEAARRADKPLCAHVGRIDPAEIAWLRERGVSAFIVASDQGLLRQAGAATINAFAGLAP